MKIAHYGTFDVANYGDALFPLLVQRRLPAATISHVSPVGGASKYTDGEPTISSIQANDLRFDAVIVGGGNILHIGRGGLPDYRAVDRTAYPSLWLGAAALAQRQRIPLIVNGLSIASTTSGPAARKMLQAFTSATSYLAVRDYFSRSVLERASASQPVEVIPDTALEVDKLWDDDHLSSVVDSNGLDGTRTIAIHMKRKYLGSEATAAAAVDSLSRHLDARPVLIAIGECHGDDKVHERVASRMTTDPLCIVPRSLAQVAALIRHSEQYFGSSMHGFLTAVAFGTPALLVVGGRPHHKFTGLLQQLGLNESTILPSWTETPQVDPSTIPAVVRADLAGRLEEHWRRAWEALQSSEVTPDSIILRRWRVMLAIGGRVDRAIALPSRVAARLPS